MYRLWQLIRNLVKLFRASGNLTTPNNHLDLKYQAKRIITQCNSGRPMVDLSAEQGSIILNCSRDSMFISVCVAIVESQGLNLKRKINLSKR